MLTFFNLNYLIQIVVSIKLLLWCDFTVNTFRIFLHFIHWNVDTKNDMLLIETQAKWNTWRYYLRSVTKIYIADIPCIQESRLLLSYCTWLCSNFAQDNGTEYTTRHSSVWFKEIVVDSRLWSVISSQFHSQYRSITPFTKELIK